mgnify:CR=1 FL=1
MHRRNTLISRSTQKVAYLGLFPLFAGSSAFLSEAELLALFERVHQNLALRGQDALAVVRHRN